MIGSSIHFRKPAFRPQGLDLLANEQRSLSQTTNAMVMYWSEERGWSELKSEFEVLSMAEDYIPTVLECGMGSPGNGRPLQQEKTAV